MKSTYLLPLLSLLALLSSVPVLADEIRLVNGDRLQGSLVKIEGEQVTWNSDSFGDLTIAKSKVEQVQISAPVKIKGQAKACSVQGMDGPLLVYHCGDSSEQIKTELAVVDRVIPYVRHTEGSYTYSGKTSVAISMKRGNEVKDDVDVDTGVEFRKSDWRHIMSVNYESRSSDDEPSDELYDLKYRLDWFFSERWFWFNELGFGMDEPKNIDERFVYGTGIGVQWWEYAHSAFSVASGLEFLKENFDPTDENLLDPNWEATRESGFWTLSYNFRRKLPYSLHLISKGQSRWSLEDSQDWELDLELGLSMPLGKRLFSEYKFEYDYDNQPNGDNRKEDKKLTVGIGYKW